MVSAPRPGAPYDPVAASGLIMRVLLAHPGIQHALRLARELERTNLLGEFWTGLALAPSMASPPASSPACAVSRG